MRELRTSADDGALWHEQIAEELEVDETDFKPPAIYKKLAHELEKAGVEQAIKSLANATAECVTEEGFCADETQDKDKVKKAAQQILGWLVLGSIDETKLNSVIPHCIKHDSLFFTLASVQSLTGIEVVMARRFNRTTDFKHVVTSEQESNRIINMPKSCIKWDAGESVRRIFVEIWNQVFRNEHRDEADYQPSQHDWDRLNSELEVRRNDDMEHYYIPFKPSVHEVAPDFIMQVYEDLLVRLQQMTVIQYGEEGQECNLFVIKEAKLQAVINYFYRKINGEKDKLHENSQNKNPS